MCSEAFRNIRYILGTTKVALALQYVIDEGFLEERTGNRPDVPDNIVVVTDGRSSDDPSDVAQRLRDMVRKNLVVLTKMKNRKKCLFKLVSFKNAIKTGKIPSKGRGQS